MSGHSKWSQIKRSKGAADVKKGAEFSKLSKLISIAAKKGVGLEAIVERAKSANMPKDNIERAIKRATDKGATELFEITVKALTRSTSSGQASGIGLIIEAVTDNKNRTIGDIKLLLSQHGAKMVEWIPDYPMPLDDDTKTLIAELEENED